jgi:hypothetical protein
MRAVALLTSTVLVLSFALFAIDQAQAASRDSQNGVASVPASDQAGQNAPAPTRPTGLRHELDAATAAICSPFEALGVRSSNAWADRGLRTLLGLAVYGWGLAFLARWSAGQTGRTRPPGRAGLTS